MGSWNSASAAILAVLALLSSILAVDLDHTTENEGVGRRALLSFKETPHGTNLTFDCSPSGPCVPCAYSEKSDEKYRCSETGHRIPFKCVEINHDSNIEKGKQRSPNGRSAVEISDDVSPHVILQETTASNKGRTLLDDSSTAKGGSQAYITYRSCISVNSENLSVLGFESPTGLQSTGKAQLGSLHGKILSVIPGVAESPSSNCGGWCFLLRFITFGERGTFGGTTTISVVPIKPLQTRLIQFGRG